jgi:hypothetical protein
MFQGLQALGRAILSISVFEIGSRGTAGQLPAIEPGGVADWL